MGINNLVSNKLPFDKTGLKYFLGYKDDKKYTFMHILSKNKYISRRDFDKTKYIFW